MKNEHLLQQLSTQHNGLRHTDDNMLHAFVPVKNLRRAKGRLAGVLSPEQRQALVLAMLSDVLTATRIARGIDQVVVVGSDDEVLSMAQSEGAAALYDQQRDLNDALAFAVSNAGADLRAALVLPGDIPLVTSREIEHIIGSLEIVPGLVLAGSRNGGTNALLVCPPLAVPFSFGPDSFALHAAAAHRAKLSIQIVHSAGLELDIDHPNDLRLLVEASGSTKAQQLLYRWMQ